YDTIGMPTTAPARALSARLSRLKNVRRVTISPPGIPCTSARSGSLMPLLLVLARDQLPHPADHAGYQHDDPNHAERHRPDDQPEQRQGQPGRQDERPDGRGWWVVGAG